MDLSINMGVGAWVLVIVASVVFGILGQFFGDTETDFEWLADAVAFGIGAIVASEFITGFRAVEPVWDELALVPALAGGLIVGIVVDAVTRLSTGGHFTTHQPMSA